MIPEGKRAGKHKNQNSIYLFLEELFGFQKPDVKRGVLESLGRSRIVRIGSVLARILCISANNRKRRRGCILLAYPHLGIQYRDGDTDDIDHRKKASRYRQKRRMVFPFSDPVRRTDFIFYNAFTPIGAV